MLVELKRHLAETDHLEVLLESKFSTTSQLRVLAFFCLRILDDSSKIKDGGENGRASLTKGVADSGSVNANIE
jgi:hypothetical protein